jgi:CxxC motif-containing protein (DUF1111 family)
MPKPSSKVLSLTPVALLLLPLMLAVVGAAQTPVDPGPRACTKTDCAGGYINGLTPNQQLMEAPGSGFFAEVNNVAGGSSVKKIGLGARFDSNACSGCHAQPANGGSSLTPTLTNPNPNPLFGVYQLMGDQNTMPSFETSNGPTLVARMPFKSDLVTPDGHVHQLFTITGRADAGTCNIQQPDFISAAAEGNLIFRNTTPFFGGGLLEIIQDSAIIANMGLNLTEKTALGISGHPNLNADDGSVNRFGWKAQKRSLLLFAGEAYNVEVGISNEFFPNKTDETPGCTPPFPDGPPNGNGPHGVPDDRADYASLPTPGFLMPGDPERFSIFGRILAPPTPSTSLAAPATPFCPGPVGTTLSNCTDGQTQFNNLGCVLCHTTSFPTPPSTVQAVGPNTANLFSDVLVHDMGRCDADNVTQGSATGDQFRTTPLWGIGQRGFFMHDGRTANIIQAIYDHSDYYSQNPPSWLTSAKGYQTPTCTGIGQYPASEADQVIQNFNNNLTQQQQQDLIDFLRSL